MTPRTLFITNDFPPRPGGIQSFVHGLVLRQPADSVVVYASAWRGARAFDESEGYPVVRHSTSLMLPTREVLLYAADIAAEHGCTHVVFGATAPLGFLAGPLKKRGIMHAVGITHGHEASWSITPLGRQSMRHIGRHLDTMTYLGEFTRARISGALEPVDAARMQRLVPGVDEQLFHPRNREPGDALRREYGLSDRRVIVCVSRLTHRKGQDVLIRSLPAIRERVPDAALLIVGGGPYRKKLEELVRQERLSRHVVITGSVPWADLPAHYGAGDVFAMPCRSRLAGIDVEGLGIVYLEASATGLPVVAGDSGGAPDAVVEGVTGHVVNGRSQEQIVNRLVGLLSDEGAARGMGARGRAWIEREWTWPTIADKFQNILYGREPQPRASTAGT